jgi:hypothetical protein
VRKHQYGTRLDQRHVCDVTKGLQRLPMSNRMRVPAVAVTAVFFFQFFGVIAQAQTGIEAEARVAAKIVQLRAGMVLKNDEGKVVSIVLFGRSDELIESIDLSVFCSLEGCLVLAPKLTKRSLVHLQKLPPSLLSLSIIGMPELDDKALGCLLQRQKSLIDLSLSGSGVTDTGLIEIGKLEQLECLCLHGTKITDRGLKSLARSQKLNLLDLSDTELSDAGLKEMKMLRHLGGLLIDGTKVTDLGIQEFAGIQTLLGLDVSHTKVTKTGIDLLKKSLPDLKVDR